MVVSLSIQVSKVLNNNNFEYSSMNLFSKRGIDFVDRKKRKEKKRNIQSQNILKQLAENLLYLIQLDNFECRQIWSRTN